MSYIAYLHSPHWRWIRERELTRADHCCEFCGADDETRLYIHHLHYDSLWDEASEDLIVLCRSCHRDAHEFPKRLAEVRAFAARRTESTRVRPSNDSD